MKFSTSDFSRASLGPGRGLTPTRAAYSPSPRSGSGVEAAGVLPAVSTLPKRHGVGAAMRAAGLVVVDAVIFGAGLTLWVFFWVAMGGR